MIGRAFRPAEASSSLFDDESPGLTSFNVSNCWSDDDEDHQMDRTLLKNSSTSRSLCSETCDRGPLLNFSSLLLNNNNKEHEDDRMSNYMGGEYKQSTTIQMTGYESGVSLSQFTSSLEELNDDDRYCDGELIENQCIIEYRNETWDNSDRNANNLLRLLPPEMYYLILTFVDFKTLLTCQIVSKEWNELTNRCEIWLPFYHMKGYSPRNSIEATTNNGLTMSGFTIFDKDGGVVNPRQKHISEEYLSWMLQERDEEDLTPSGARKNANYRSLFMYKALQKFDKKNRKNELIDMYYNLNDLVLYLPTLKRACYWFFSIGILIFSILFPLLMDDEGKFKNIENLGFYYLIYVLVCYGPVFIGHACCLILCYWVYRKHVNLSYHDQSERILIFSMTNATSYLLDVTFETQLLCSVPLTFCIPIFMRMFDWGHTVSMFPLVTTIMAQKFFYFVYEVQREKILRRKKWESLRAVNTVILFQVALICFKLDNMLVLRYIFGDIVMALNWRMVFIPAHIFGFIYCATNIHALQIKKHLFSLQQRNDLITRKCVMFVACLLFYLFFFYFLGLKLDMREKLDYSFLYIFIYWYVVNVIYVLLKQERIRSHLM